MNTINYMKSLRDWAIYYYNSAVAIIPSYLEYKEIDFDSPYRQEKSRVNSFCWEQSDAIKGVVGINGLTILKLNLKNKDAAYIYQVVTKVLALLNFYNYPWAIQYKDSILILFECWNVTSFKDRDDFGDITIYWRNFIYDLPFETASIHSDAKFFFSAVPTIRPLKIYNDDLREVVKTLIEEFGVFFNK